jgi:GNAT superfamily N-acetyltransferase
MAITSDSGFQIRFLGVHDVESAMRLKDEEGWNQSAEDWQRFLSESPRGCFAAEKDGQVVGTATTIVYGDSVAWISMVLVDRRYRGGGIGKGLLGAAITHIEGLGVPTIKLDATPEGRPLYAKLGFIDEYEIERWTLRRPTPAADVRPAHRPAAAQGDVHAALDDIVRLDRLSFGADRRPLVGAVAAAAPELVIQARRGGELEGFALGRHGSHADQLGPLVARDAATVRQILDEFLDRTSRSEVYVDRVCAHPWGRSVLLARDFQPTRPLMRMYRGSNASPGEAGWRCAIMGPEFG